MTHSGGVILRATVICVFAACCCVSALPLPSWPADDNDWDIFTIGPFHYHDRVYQGGNPNMDYYDTPPASPSWDLVAHYDADGNHFALAYTHMDADYFYVRMRTSGPPGANPQFVWQVLLNTDADSDVDWSLQLDLSSDDQVEMAAALSGGPSNGWHVVLAATHYPATGSGRVPTDFYRFVNTSSNVVTPDPPYEGSNFISGGGGSNEDHFLDIAYPLHALGGDVVYGFENLIGYGPFDPTDRTAFSTSTTHTQTNKDLPEYADWDTQQPGGFIPEPASMSLLVLGLLAIRRRRR